MKKLNYNDHDGVVKSNPRSYSAASGLAATDWVSFDALYFGTRVNRLVTRRLESDVFVVSFEQSTGTVAVIGFDRGHGWMRRVSFLD
jgi:hypothetical protein